MKTFKSVFFTSIAMLLSIVSNNAMAQSCTSCFTATPDVTNSSYINLDGSCSNVSPSANYEWYVDGTLMLSFPFPYFGIPFSSPGTYTITLVVDDLGCIDSSSQTVTITNSCSAAFTAYTFGGGMYYFYGNTLYGPTATFSWDYGDGTTDNVPFGSHVYNSVGTYNVCCIVSDTAFGGCTDTFCQTINVTTTSSTCLANFSAYINPFPAEIVADASFSQYNPVNYGFTWVLNGNVVQQGSSPYFYYLLSAVGNYDIKLFVTDSNNNACDSMTQSIYYNGGIIGGSGCYPCFSYYYNGTYDSVYVDATCSVIPPGGSLSWNVNGVNVTPGSMPFLQGFSSLGAQTISLILLDSLNNPCDSTYQIIYTYPPPCTSCLTVSQVVGSTSDYVFDATCSGFSASNAWFVNGVYITNSTNPQFNCSFTSSGSYDICLQTIDSNGNYCNQSCTTINVTTPPVTQFDLEGTIYKVDSNYMYVTAGAAEAKVYLIKLITGGTLEAIDSTMTDAFGRYEFNNKPIDDYRVKVALMPSSADYAYNIPTYYNTAIMWYDAQVVTLFGNTYNRDIFMNYGINTGGSGFISGNVFLGSNKPSRTTNVGITLVLIDQATQKPIAYTKPNANGDYQFGNIPDGSYRIFGELLNRASIPDNIVINATQQIFTGKNFMYNDNVIMPTSNSLSVGNIDKPIEFVLAPNPASTGFTIYNQRDAFSLKVLDMTGRVVYEANANENQNLVIDCSRWNKGMYIVQSNKAGQKTSQKLMVK